MVGRYAIGTTVDDRGGLALRLVALACISVLDPLEERVLL